jgi:hypothetical protein
MDIQIITKRLMKVAQNLDSNSFHLKAARIREICAEIAKFFPQYQTEESEKERLIADIKRAIPGTAVKGTMNPVHDATYYDVEFRSGTKVLITETHRGPFRTLPAETVKKPYGVALMKTDVTGKETMVPGGITKSREELIPYLQKLAIGSEKEMAEVSKERKIKCAFTEVQP